LGPKKFGKAGSTLLAALQLDFDDRGCQFHEAQLPRAIISSDAEFWAHVKVYLAPACTVAAPAVVHLLPAGGWKAPKTPLLAVPLNMTAGYNMWQNMDAALKWARTWAKGKPAIGA
jgi:hypothetical protein